jgi:hypothetical protein
MSKRCKAARMPLHSLTPTPIEPTKEYEIIDGSAPNNTGYASVQNMSVVRPEHGEEERETAIEIGASILSLQQLLLALPLGSQLAVLLAVLGLQAGEAHPCPCVTGPPLHQSVHHAKVGGVPRPSFGSLNWAIT